MAFDALNSKLGNIVGITTISGATNEDGYLISDTIATSSRMIISVKTSIAGDYAIAYPRNNGYFGFRVFNVGTNAAVVSTSMILTVAFLRREYIDAN